MLKKQFKHSKRYQEILNAFFKHGFSHFLFRIGLTDRALKKESAKDINMNFKDIGTKLRQTLQSLGPTFIKLGQIASARRDLVPKEIADELEKLQDEVDGFPFEDVRQIIEAELGDTIDHLFASIDRKPIATASIGQVHMAKTFQGEDVAIKVQRPDIAPTVKIDLEILHDIALLMEAKIGWARAYHIRDMMEEFSHSLQNELNYHVEGRNAERIQNQFTEDETVYIPKIYWDYTTQKVLTMERINGIKVTNLERIENAGYDRGIIAERLANAMFEQVLENGYFHGDPHPGNIFIMPNNVVSFIDFGMVGQITDDMKFHFASLVIQVKQQNAKGMIKTFAKMNLLDNVENIDALHHELDTLLAKYYDASLQDISLGAVIIEVFHIAFRHQVDIPKDIAIISKAILTMEDIIKLLDPDFSIMKAVEPYGTKLLKKRYHPKRVLEQSFGEFTENVDVLKDIPKDIKQISSLIKKGKLQLGMNITELQAFLKRLDRISNRLSFSIILLSFSILMGGLIIGASISGHTTMLWRLPIIEIGSVIATLMFLFMIFTIIRSGRM